METIYLQDIKEKLTEKRRNLALWLETTPASEKDLHLGPAGEEAVEEHIHVIDEALDKAGSGSLGICKICGDPVDDELLEMDYTARVCLSHLTPSKALPRARAGTIQDDPKGVAAAGIPVPGLILRYSSARPRSWAVISSISTFQRWQIRHRHCRCGREGIFSQFDHVQHADGPARSSRKTISADVVSRVNGLFAHNIHFTIFVTYFWERMTHKSDLHLLQRRHNPPLLPQTGWLWSGYRSFRPIRHSHRIVGVSSLQGRNRFCTVAISCCLHRWRPRCLRRR
jgi:RNA polymerase-binding transcription factor DksA